MTVYVTQQPVPNAKGWTPDLSSASEYGKIEFVFNGGEKIYALPGPSMNKARQMLKNFNAEEDYILWPGSCDPASLKVCMIVLVLLGVHKIKTLYWDRERDRDGNRSKSRGFYKPVTFEIVHKSFLKEPEFNPLTKE